MTAPPLRLRGPTRPGGHAESRACRLAQGGFPDRCWLAAECCRRDDRRRLAELSGYAEATGLPLLAAGDVHMHLRARRVLQDTLTAIRLGAPVKTAAMPCSPTASGHCARSSAAALYPAALRRRAVRVAALCRFSLDSLRYEYPDKLVPVGTTPHGTCGRSPRPAGAAYLCRVPTPCAA